MRNEFHLVYINTDDWIQEPEVSNASKDRIYLLLYEHVRL